MKKMKMKKMKKKKKTRYMWQGRTRNKGTVGRRKQQDEVRGA